MEFSETIEVTDRGSSIDVQSNCTFDSLMIGKKTLERLAATGFHRPSPVQAKAIPVGLLGRDMLVQAKSGTGKTLVFSVLAVENLDLEASYVQKLIVAPTREIAVQIRETVRKISPVGSRTSVFVGGIPYKQNISELKTTHPQIIIGTTGRICQLMKDGELDISRVDLFVLDEADKMMDDVFKDDVNYIMNSLPPVRQVCVFSATYPRSLDSLLTTFLRNAAHVRFSADDVQLVGIKQYVITNCSPMPEKLTQVLKSVIYVQALVFCDQVAKCEPLAAHLKSEGLDVTYVSSAMSQKERQLAVDRLRTKRVKILVSSDLTARGIDADNVNLVVNVDAAANEETYFHRIGRAARFGAHGAAITLLEDEKAAKCFTALAYRGRVTVKRAKLTDLPGDLPKNKDFWEGLPFYIDLDKKMEKLEKNDLDKVPDRKSAVEALQSQRSVSEASFPLKYDRSTMMALQTKKLEDSEVPKAPEEPQTTSKPKFCEDGQEKEEETVKAAPKTFKERMADLKALRAAKKAENAANPQKIEVKEEKKPKFKFVPTREKAKKKYYMRGELQHIREQFSAEQWRAYAATKYDLEQEPFVKTPNSVNEPAEATSGASEPPEPSKLAAESPELASEASEPSEAPRIPFKSSENRLLKLLKNFGASRTSQASSESTSGASPSSSSPSRPAESTSAPSESLKPTTGLPESASGASRSSKPSPGPQRPSEPSSGASRPSGSSKPSQGPSKSTSGAPGSSKSSKKGPKGPKTQRYSRYKMIQIQMGVPKDQWLPYVTSKWDTSEEPWELNPTNRGSHAEKFRRQRFLEKEERKKVMEERRKKRLEDRTELVSSGRTSQVLEIGETSWEQFKERVRKDFEKMKVAREEKIEMEKQGKEFDPKRIGPVVPFRDSPLNHRCRVDMYKRQLEQQDAWLEQETKLESKQIFERDAQTDEVEDQKELVDGECQTEEVKVENEEEDEEIEDEEYWDEEYWDEDEEEWYEDEEEDSGAPEAANSQIPTDLGNSYIRNLNFQAFQQSYMDMMNAAVFRRQ